MVDFTKGRYTLESIDELISSKIDDIGPYGEGILLANELAASTPKIAPIKIEKPLLDKYIELYACLGLGLYLQYLEVAQDEDKLNEYAGSREMIEQALCLGRYPDVEETEYSAFSIDSFNQMMKKMNSFSGKLNSIEEYLDNMVLKKESAEMDKNFSKVASKLRELELYALRLYSDLAVFGQIYFRENDILRRTGTEVLSEEEYAESADVILGCAICLEGYITDFNDYAHRVDDLSDS